MGSLNDDAWSSNKRESMQKQSESVDAEFEQISHFPEEKENSESSLEI